MGKTRGGPRSKDKKKQDNRKKQRRKTFKTLNAGLRSKSIRRQ